MGVIDILADGASDFVGWLLIGLVGLLTVPGKVLANVRSQAKQNSEDIEELERYLKGDPEDPGSPGLMQDIHDIKTDVRDIKTALDDELDNAEE